MAHRNAGTAQTIRPLNPGDEVFLRLDTIRSVGHGGAVLVFDARNRAADAFSAQTMRELVAEKLPRLGPLRWRLGFPPHGEQGHHWIDGEAPDLRFHVSESDLGGAAGLQELAAKVVQLDARPLRRTRPLWELNVVGGLADSRVAVQLRIHHSLADAIVIQGILDELFGDGRPREAPHAAPLPPVADPSHDEALPEGGVGTAPATRFSLPLSGQRDLALETVPTERLFELKAAVGVTFATLVCAVAAGALRSWLLERDELPTEPLVALIPSSIRQAGDTTVFGNRLRLIRVPLPTHEPEPRRRLELAGSGLLAARRTPPKRAAGRKRGNLSLSTVDGMSYPLTWAGAPLGPTYPIGMVTQSGPSIACHTGPQDTGLALHVDRAQGEGGWSLLEAFLAAIAELESCV